MTPASRAARFIVLAQARTGSTLLAKMLDTHPDIHCEREIFNPNDRYFPKALLAAGRRFPYPFLCWRSLRNRDKVYGCKVMVYEINRLGDALRRLVERDWRILHLERNDVVGAAISDLLAGKRGLWHRELGSTAPRDTVPLEADLLQAVIRWRLQLRNRERAALTGLPHLHLVYEEDFSGELALRATGERVLEYLGLSIRPLQVDLVPSDDRSLSEVVPNLDELLDGIRRTDMVSLLDHFQAHRQTTRA